MRSEVALATRSEVSGKQIYGWVETQLTVGRATTRKTLGEGVLGGRHGANQGRAPRS